MGTGIQSLGSRSSIVPHRRRGVTGFHMLWMDGELHWVLQVWARQSLEGVPLMAGAIAMQLVLHLKRERVRQPG